ncbi:uncharacterized protein LOC141593047 [Silene latifolia]|uniref:uncharacterized protein LOC141593047 n=1 Tax=Silene latifolia TaxID=37657 RepID=UPI003D76A879
MSKKKTSGGNTMTLKDFHGGSIPSDLPLPSAPGVIVRSTNDHRPGYDRQMSWGNSVNRSSDHRLRPSSSGSMRNNSLDDKTPFLSTSANIGRNFDEDERKPLDGGSSVPRRIVNDDIIRGPVVRSEPRMDVGRVAGGRESLGLGVGGNSYSARVVEGGNSGAVTLGVRSNPWGVRKEVAGVGPVGAVVNETVSNTWGGGQSTASKLAQASALDQISSGRWQTKPVHHQVDVEVIRQSESPSSLYVKESEYFGGGGRGSEREFIDTTLVRHVERGLAIDDGVRGNFKEVPGVERVQSPRVFDGREKSSVLFTNNGQPTYPEGKYVNSEPLVHQEEKTPEKPKLKLLPRKKPLGVPEPSIVDYKQEPQQWINSIPSEMGSKGHGNVRHVKPGLASNEVSHAKTGLSSSEAANQVVERPKLNLKPRSQPLDQSEVNNETKRVPLFGGARPRETVLKERGVDDVVSSNEETQPTQGPNRMRKDIPRTEVAPAHTSIQRHAERVPNHTINHRSGTGRGHDKKEQQTDVQKADTQRNNWRNENWRSARDNEKQPPKQERPTSPETWRKPIEQSKPADAHNSLRFGKAVSAVELAQAFSNPVSDPKSLDRFSGQRGLPGRTQIPFSRLTGPPTRPQLNGY